MKNLRIVLSKNLKYNGIPAFFDFTLQKFFYLAGALQFLPMNFFVCEAEICRKADAFQKFLQCRRGKASCGTVMGSATFSLNKEIGMKTEKFSTETLGRRSLRFIGLIITSENKFRVN